MLSLVCKDVRKEPSLSTTPDSNDELWADISVFSFSKRLQRAYAKLRVFTPFTSNYRRQSLVTTMKVMENQKKKKCNQRILDDKNGSFTPLIFTTNSGMSTETKKFFRRLSQMLCEKLDVSYSDTSAWVKRQISFCLLWTSMVCIWGSWSKKYNIPTEKTRDTDVANRVVDINQKLRW